MSATESDNDKTITNMPIKEGKFILHAHTVRNVMTGFNNFLNICRNK